MIGGLELNEDTVEVSVDGEPVRLTPIEYKILLLLMKSPGRVFLQRKFMSVYGMKKRSIPIRLWSTSGISVKKLRSTPKRTKIFKGGVGRWIQNRKTGIK